MASLKTPLLAALVFLALILQTTEAGPYGTNVEDSVCCREYFRHPLPLRMIRFFYWTSDSCRRPGVVFLTVKDREICADPRMPWVKKILQKLSA
ncbi:C-C motif chemokine 22 [Mustela erminea]|uniref:C-C motif chemokine 22 n=1 Tax=Mustela erminea TaxID=36723 RepID=UPI001386F200|nr:C-C motif chemokine 22 [Mustela erminea]